MPQVTRSEAWNIPIDQIYEVLQDYDSYPEFVDGCSSTRIISKDESGAEVEFGLNLIKKFKYILTLKHDRPHSISWIFKSGDIFKKNEGSWHLKDLGEGKTQVTYGLEVEIKGFAPKSIVSNLTEKNLPAMLKSYHDRALERI